jgi:ubiquitin C-terminal hydrolase
LDEVFGGTLMQAVRCSTNKEHVSKSEDRFLTLSVDIENKSELDQALASYFDGDNISSYHCEKCNQKVNAVKQFRLKRLSNTLIIHLKRFKFNVLSMQKEKLQNRIQFPLTLNVKKFLDEIPAKMTEDDYTYDLKGILVHTGTADAGHYYSFIKERDHAARWFVGATSIFAQ